MSDAVASPGIVMMPTNVGSVEGCQASLDAKTADAPPNPIRVGDSNDVSVPQLAEEAVDDIADGALPMLALHSDFSGKNRVWARRSGGVFVMFIVMAISVYNMYRIADPKEYPKITRDEQFSSKGGTLPQIGFFVRNNTPMSFEVMACTFLTETQVCVPRKTNRCTIALGLPGNHREDQIQRESHCLPPDMEILGIFGDSEYKYVEISFFMKPHASKPGTAEEVHVMIQEKPEKDKSFFYDYPFSFLNSGYWTCIEMFFKQKIIYTGQVDGIFGRMITGFKQYLPSDEFLKYTSHVRRKDLTKRPTNTSRLLVPDGEHVFSIMLRSDLLLSREFYEQTSFMLFFEQSGGLWTSLGIMCSVILVVVFSLLRRLRVAWTFCLTRSITDGRDEGVVSL
eukprot:TRINITY_DN5215_c0_g1_i1.p1 TRINITY_DN5215_c0_g1~~TRINITY_DN5215_c0_g1_i1.p1  ORF type:complete len:420 (+),score=48.64 TRINITY_DN5215_c0_g1_i1:78-1262(+)